MNLNKIKDNLTFYGLSLLLLGFVFIIINSASYLDPLGLCYVKIEGDIVRGNETTIHKALRLIKRENKSAYRDICKYVDVISEKNCIVADWKISGDEYAEGMKLPGCYARGSKTIYLKYDKSTSDATIKSRADDIIKYSGFSKKFWSSK